MNSFARRPKAWEQRRNPAFANDAALCVMSSTHESPFNSHDREGEAAIWGRCSDLSEEGLGATIVGSLNLGEMLPIQLPLHPHEPPVSLQAAVRYQNGFHYGFELLTMNDATREALRSTCAGLAQDIL
jgi:hypothetical protein